MFCISNVDEELSTTKNGNGEKKESTGVPKVNCWEKRQTS